MSFRERELFPYIPRSLCGFEKSDDDTIWGGGEKGNTWSENGNVLDLRNLPVGLIVQGTIIACRHGVVVLGLRIDHDGVDGGKPAGGKDTALRRRCDLLGICAGIMVAVETDLVGVRTVSASSVVSFNFLIRRNCHHCQRKKLQHAKIRVLKRKGT